MNEKPLPLLMLPSQVAKAFNADPKSPARWAKAGLLETVRTPLGHRRFVTESVWAHLAKDGASPERIARLIRVAVGIEDDDAKRPITQTVARPAKRGGAA